MPDGVGAFGKMPSAGDFFRLNAPPGFVRAWDGWLQQAMLEGQRALGPAWDDAYMSAPIWRFTLTAGLAGPHKAQGVLMPSVDRVGRRFPLTLMRALDTPGPAPHDHFTAEVFLGWLNERDAGVSRATVYRTLGLLVEGGFLELLDVGTGEAHYEHVLGHQHHDHLICTGCGRIEEFREARIEALQEEVAAKYGFVLEDHDLRLMGRCKSCQRKAKGS